MQWNNENIGKIADASPLSRALFLASNLVFFCGCSWLSGIGCVSVMFHGYQCMHDDRVTLLLMWTDTILTTVAAFVFVATHATHVTILWALLWIPVVVLYATGSGKRGSSNYMITHSLWHLGAGALLLWLGE
ncbi:MAG: hypothetical protein CL902_00485 [Dehalococcoidia bacterium]|nr:hypothetical protein [Dehalococcoidia bacterium]